MTMPPEIARFIHVGIVLVAILALAYRPRWLPWVAVAAIVLIYGPVAAGRLQTWNLFHYYINAKYVGELGYYQLYNCAAAALPDEIGPQVVRNLETYKYTTGNALPPCAANFSPARWQEFTADLAWLDGNGQGPGIADAVRDKGLNTTPPWLWLASTLAANTTPGSPAFWIGVNLDVIALVAALIFVLLTTRQVTAVSLAVINLSTWLGSASFVMGHWLQWLWLAALFVALAAWRRRRHGLAGAMIAIASIDRIFPAVLFLWPLLHRRKVGRRFWSAAIAVGMMGVVAGSSTPAGMGVWPEFVRKMASHSAAIAAEPGVNVGLRNMYTMLSNPDSAVDTFAAFAIGDVGSGVRTAAPAWTWLPVAVFVALAVYAIRRRAWLSFSDALLVIFPAMTLSHYYYAWLSLNALEADRNDATYLLLLNLVGIILAYFALDTLTAYGVVQIMILVYVYRRINQCLKSSRSQQSLPAWLSAS